MAMLKRQSPQQMEANLANIPEQWANEFFGLLPVGCRFNLADSEWLAAHYRAGLTPEQAFKSCKIIEL